MSQSTHSPSLRQSLISRAVSPAHSFTASLTANNIASLQVDSIGVASLTRAALISFTLGAFALRLVLINTYPLREDEATYAYWALHGWLEDPLFLHVWPDKPPIFLWLLSGAYQLFGVSEASARYVNIAASTLTIPVTAAVANRLWGRSASIFAAVAIALSPFAISFAPTVYTDPILVLFGLLALYLAVYGRGLLAGLVLGLAVMTKQQGVLYTPLVLGALLAVAYVDRSGTRRTVRQLLAFTIGLLLIVAPILYWDSLRWAVAPSPWDLGAHNYAALSVLRPQDWLANAGRWSRQAWYLAASWSSWLSYFVLLSTAVTVSLRRRERGASNRSTVFGVLIAAWSVGFLALHVTTTVQPWDRYLLPMAPMLALVAGWGFSRLSVALPVPAMVLVGLLLATSLIGPAQSAANGKIAIGADHGDLVGLPVAIRTMQAMNDGSYVLYHHELGSQFRYYLHGAVLGADEPQAKLRWFPSETYLADNAAKATVQRRFFIEPDWAPNRNLNAHLRMRGLSLTNHGRYGRFTVWEIQHLPQTGHDGHFGRLAQSSNNIQDSTAQTTLFNQP